MPEVLLRKSLYVMHGLSVSVSRRYQVAHAGPMLFEFELRLIKVDGLATKGTPYTMADSVRSEAAAMRPRRSTTCTSGPESGASLG